MDLTKLITHLPTDIYSQLPLLASFGVDGPKRLSNLLGQCKHETGNWLHFEENLNYSADGLLRTFPSHFTGTEALAYEHQPIKIANRVYANRLGNSDESSGEGYLPRGMGCIQLTGKSNQQAFFSAMGLSADSDPELIATNYSLISAAWFFREHNLWTIADHGTDFATASIITRTVNGPALLGLDNRVQYTQQFYSWLTA